MLLFLRTIKFNTIMCSNLIEQSNVLNLSFILFFGPRVNP